MRGEWTAGHLQEWQQSMDRIAGALMDKRTAVLTQADVLSVIEPAAPDRTLDFCQNQWTCRKRELVQIGEPH